MLLMWISAAVGCQSKKSLDEQLSEVITRQGLRAVEVPAAQPPAKVALGQALFFDPVMSGRMDTSCATCHHPSFGTGDGRALSIGVGGAGLGPARVIVSGEDRELTPRNASALFNLGDSAWRSQFWDSRVELLASGEARSPAGGSLPAGLDNIIAVQAMFPVTSRDEMRGERGEARVDGEENELGEHFDSRVSSIWEGITARLIAIPEYRALFARAYPDVRVGALEYRHAANAIAAFEIEAFSLTQTPWDRYLRGERDALSAPAKRGALLFFGEAGCGSCHSGALLTDQKHYNIGVPQLGPGKRPEEPLDYGRSRVLMEPQRRYRFRTPALRQVAHTGPYMHNGAYTSLRDVIAHHAAPRESLRGYDGGQLPEALRSTLLTESHYTDELEAMISPEIGVVPALDDAQVDDLIAFLEALGDSSLQPLERWIPDTVPSGLPVDRLR